MYASTVSDSPSPISEESVANIAVSLATEQKKKKGMAESNCIHNLKELTAVEGSSRKKDYISKSTSLFQT